VGWRPSAVANDIAWTWCNLWLNPPPLRSETHTHSKSRGTCPKLPEDSKFVTILFLFFFWFWIHTANAPIISGSRFSSSKLRRTWVFLFRFFYIYWKKQVLLCLVVGGGGCHRSWTCTQGLYLLLRALTNETERTLDLPEHGAARACPWLSTALVAGSVRRGRGGDRYSQRFSQGAGGGSGHPRFFKIRWHEEAPGP